MIINTLRADFLKIYKYRYVISSYVTINLRMRYRRSFIGFLWTILAPMMQYLIIAVMFTYAIGSREANFFSYFFTGSVIFNVFSITFQRAPTIMLANEVYIKKIYLPKMIYVLNTCAYELTNFILTAAMLLLIGLLSGKIILSYSLLAWPVHLLLLVLLLLGGSSILSVAGVFFRDLIYIIPQIMQALFFLTPIIYKADVFPPWIRKIIQFNPIYHIIEIFRHPIIYGRLAPLHHYSYAFLFSATLFIIGYWIIKKYDNRIIFKL
jgi:ABC-2 type transport system permease protein